MTTIDSASLRNETIPSKEPAVLCAFTVDVEDWYQSSVDFDAPITERVLYNVDAVLMMLDHVKVKGTFFIQGLVAKKFPTLAQQLLREGHEVQSHGHTHRPLYKMDRRALRAELEAGKKSVEDACGVKVTAFRAPDFSILNENLWALELLNEAGFEVDSSIFPKKMKRYGIAGWSCTPQRVPLPNGGSIIEAPVAILELGGMRLPFAGGGYFRLLPGPVLYGGVKAMIHRGTPVILYCHPYEFNPLELEQFRGRVPDRFIFTQSLGRTRFRQRMQHLLTSFPFGRLNQVISTAMP